MIMNTWPKKAALAALLAGLSIAWLNHWHKFVYTRSAITFPPVSTWLRDALMVLLPVFLAIWLGLGLARWLIDRFASQLSPSTQSVLVAGSLGIATSISILLVESNRMFRTGIGNEFTFLASICGRLTPSSYPVLSLLRWIFPTGQAFRLHILFQDGSNLALINMAATILIILVLEALTGTLKKLSLEPTRLKN